MTRATFPWRLLGIGAPMAVWALHFVAVYALQGLACAEGIHHARAWMVALALAAWALLAWSGRRAWRAWHAARGGAPGAADARRRFAAAVTGALCVLAAVAIGFTTLPVMLLPGCAT